MSKDPEDDILQALADGPQGMEDLHHVLKVHMRRVARTMHAIHRLDPKQVVAKMGKVPEAEGVEVMVSVGDPLPDVTNAREY